MQYFHHPAYRDALKIGEEFLSRDDLLNQAMKHSEMVNPGAVLSNKEDSERLQVYCDGGGRVQCRYGLSATVNYNGRQAAFYRVTRVSRQRRGEQTCIGSMYVSRAICRITTIA